MIAQLRSMELHVPTEEGMRSGWVRLYVGPSGGPGEESFDIFVCTPDWLEQEVAERGHRWGRSMLVVAQFDLVEVEKIVKARVATIDGADWSEVARRLALLADWEFQDYRP